MKVFWAILAFLILIPSAVALECQYTVPANYEQTIEQVVTPDGRVLGDFIELGEPVPYLDETGCGFEIAVTNEEEIPVRITITWRINLTDSTGPHVITDSFKGKKLAPHEKAKIQRSYPNTATCTLLLPTLTYIVEDTASVDIKTAQRPLIGEACKMCNGVACVDDGSHCDTGAQCGSGSCYAGVCIGACPSGDTSCVSLCSAVDTCSSGICDMNRGVCSLCVGNACDCSVLSPDHVQCPDTAACILPGSKENGQGYACTKECVSGYGEEGVCMMTQNERQLRNVIAIILIVAGSIILFLIILTGSRSKELARINHDIKREVQNRTETVRIECENEVAAAKQKVHSAEISASSAIQDLRRKHEIEATALEQKLHKMQQNIQKSKEAIYRAQTQKETAESNLKKATERITQETARNEKLIENVKQQKMELEQNTQLLAEQSAKYLDMQKQYYEECLTPRNSEHANGHEVIRNPDDHMYEYFYEPGWNLERYTAKKNKAVHRWRAHKYIWDDPKYATYIVEIKKRYGNEFDKLHVHHIDGDKYNNATENLSLMDRGTHKNLHYKHKINGKETGLKAMRAEGVPIPSDFLN